MHKEETHGRNIEWSRIKISFTLSQPIEIQSEFSSTGSRKGGKKLWLGGGGRNAKNHTMKKSEILFSSLIKKRRRSKGKSSLNIWTRAKLAWAVRRTLLPFKCYMTTFYSMPSSSLSNFKTRARICKCLRTPGIDSASLRSRRAGTTNRVILLAAWLHGLAKSIPWNRFLDSLNVYKLGLSNIHNIRMEPAHTMVASTNNFTQC
jgi:hypothetical protein